MKMMTAGNSHGNRFAAVRLLVFDLDGTLIDSRRDLILSVNAARERMALTPLSDATVLAFIGHGARDLVRHAIAAGSGADLLDPGAPEVERALGYFREYYAAHLLDHTVTYPGVREALAGLDDRTLAVLTNKPIRFTLPILEGLGLAPLFRRICGEDTFSTRKPDPEGLNTLLAEFKMAPGEAMMVGDSETDVLTARNAGTWMCGVTYGLSSHRLVEYPPDLMVSSLTELLPVLNGE
jgi:phosphoglycolate phosphatase